jgi:hypothetical protein
VLLIPLLVLAALGVTQVVLEDTGEGQEVLQYLVIVILLGLQQVLDMDQLSNFDKHDTPERTFFPLNLITTTDIRNSRLKVCKDCDKLKMSYICNECGCYVYAKTWLKSSKCPLNKWTK